MVRFSSVDPVGRGIRGRGERTDGCPRTNLDEEQELGRAVDGGHLPQELAVLLTDLVLIVPRLLHQGGQEELGLVLGQAARITSKVKTHEITAI